VKQCTRNCVDAAAAALSRRCTCESCWQLRSLITGPSDSIPWCWAISVVLGGCKHVMRYRRPVSKAFLNTRGGPISPLAGTH